MATLDIKQWAPPGPKDVQLIDRNSEQKSREKKAGERKPRKRNSRKQDLKQPPSFSSEATALTRCAATHSTATASLGPYLQPVVSPMQSIKQFPTGNFDPTYATLPDESYVSLQFSGTEEWNTSGGHLKDRESNALFTSGLCGGETWDIMFQDSQMLQLLAQELHSTDTAQVRHQILPHVSSNQGGQSFEHSKMPSMPNADIITTFSPHINAAYCAMGPTQPSLPPQIENDTGNSYAGEARLGVAPSIQDSAANVPLDAPTVSSDKVECQAEIGLLTPESDYEHISSSPQQSRPNTDEPRDVPTSAPSILEKPPADIELATPQSDSISLSVSQHTALSKSNYPRGTLIVDLEEHQASGYSTGKDEGVGQNKRRRETDVDHSKERQPNKRQKPHIEGRIPQLTESITTATAKDFRLSHSIGDCERSHDEVDCEDDGGSDGEDDSDDSFDSDHESHTLSDRIDSDHSESPAASSRKLKEVERRPWTKIHEVLLDAYVKEKMPWPWIARQLKRSQPAVKQHWSGMQTTKSTKKDKSRPTKIPASAHADTDEEERGTSPDLASEDSISISKPLRQRQRLALISPRHGKAANTRGLRSLNAPTESKPVDYDEVPPEHDWEAIDTLGEEIVNGEKHIWVLWAPTITDNLDTFRKLIRKWNATHKEIVVNGKRLYWIAWPPTLEPKNNLGAEKRALKLRDIPTSREYTPEEDRLIIDLRNRDLKWKDIYAAYKEAFPHKRRTIGGLTLRYHNLLKGEEWGGFDD